MAANSDFFDRVLAHIEAHLFAPLSVGVLADVAGLSPYHFSRAFTARFGESVMSYVRARRMEEAAAKLAGENPPSLVDLAFDCGFESQEAFTRAFKREFSTPPGRYKRETEKKMTEQANVKLDMVMLDGVQRRDAFTVAGVSARFDDNTKSGIPALWPKLIARLPLGGQKDARSYGVCRATGERDGSIFYMAAVEVDENTPLPAGLERLRVAAQSYLVFRIRFDGPNLHPQIQAAMKEIWSNALPNSKYKLAQAPDFELYPENFDPARPGATIDYYIPVVA